MCPGTVIVMSFRMWAVVALVGVFIVGVVVLVFVAPRVFFSATEQSGLDKAQRVMMDGQLPVASGVSGLRGDIEVVVENLKVPWEIAWLPDGQMLVTERSGRLLKIGDDRFIIPVEGVAQVGEGGLMGMALHPKFKENQWIYLYLTARAGEGLINRVERYRLEGDELKDRQVILDKIPGARFHDGGRLAFGPDGFLYITVGDARSKDEAQDISSLNGTILRVRDDGSLPTDNPFGTAVYSYGHRNSQGLAWDDKGRLWATEHGRSGFKSGLDELNLIEAGKNYGWPVIEGDKTEKGMELPVVHSGADITWAPAGAAWYDGSIFFVGLRGESLYEAKLSGSFVVEVVPHFFGQFGRLRVVNVGPDGWIYIATSNTDGRGEARAGDDKIIRINPKLFR